MDTSVDRIADPWGSRTPYGTDEPWPARVDSCLAETQPVQWIRVLDRLEGSAPPRIVCIDPRPTQAARRSAAHLAPRAGTNVALLNALLHGIIRTGRIDQEYITAHTVGWV
jgi:anaerobic selenocysteine-containing dehydrogenase